MDASDFARTIGNEMKLHHPAGSASITQLAITRILATMQLILMSLLAGECVRKVNAMR